MRSSAIAAGALVAAFAAFASDSASERRRLVLADESRAKLHYYDSADPKACFAVDVEKPVWDLKKTGAFRYRIVCDKGFMIVDMSSRRVVETFRHPSLDVVTAVCDLPDGGFVASVNPQKPPDFGKTVLLRRFDSAGRLVSTYRLDGLFYARSMQWDRDGRTLLLAWEKGFVKVRLPGDPGGEATIEQSFVQPAGRNLFDVVPELSGGGYIAGCGYKGGLVRFDSSGKAVRSWFVPEKDGLVSFFYAQVKELPDGGIYMGHWTGHGENDSRKGWQVVEFGPDGAPRWHLYDPGRFGSISGVDILEAPRYSPPELACDVAVVGGGSAGFAAAWKAASSGADVVLVERESRLGGTSVAGGVSSWEPVCGADGLPEMLYDRLKAEGAAGVYRFVHHCAWPENGRPCEFPGALLETDPSAGYGDTLRRHGPGIKDEAWFRKNCRGIIFNPDAMARAMRAMLAETGRCRVMTDYAFVSAEREGDAIVALRLADGTSVRPKVVVDACGAVAKAAGCELMRSERPNGATLVYRVAKGEKPLAELKPCRWAASYPYAFCMHLPSGEIAVNMLPTMDGAEAARLGERAAYEECLDRCRDHWRWMQERWPDFKAWHFASAPPVLACRDTFRVVGDCVLTGADVRGGVRPADEIATADHALDAHGGDGFGGELSAPYGIPYRCLLAKGVSNLLVAGRVASFDSAAATSCRLSRTMMKLGEAAGAAAAISAASRRPLRAVGADEVREAVGSKACMRCL